MPVRIAPQAESLYGTPQPLATVFSPPVIAKRDPTTSDTGYPLGQEWINKVLNNTWFLTSVVAGVANWEAIPGGSIVLDVAHGGTGATSFTAHGVLIGEGTAPVQSTAAGTDGQVLTANTGANPTFDNIGTKSGLTQYGVVVAEGAAAFNATAAGTSGEVLTATTGADPSFQGLGYNSGLTGLVLGNNNAVFSTITYSPGAAWTPAFSLSTPGDSAWTYTGASTFGEYTQIGDVVWITARLVWTNFTNGTGSGTWQVNLPIASGPNSFTGHLHITGSGIDISAEATNYPVNFVALVAGSASDAVLSAEEQGATQSSSGVFNLTVSQVLTTGDMTISGWYFLT